MTPKETQACLRFAKLVMKTQEALLYHKDAKPFINIIRDADASYFNSKLEPVTLTEAEAYIEARRSVLEEHETKLKAREVAIAKWQIQLEATCKALAKQVEAIPKTRLKE